MMGSLVAYTLAVLDDEEMAHPPIEAIFTVNEEKSVCLEQQLLMFQILRDVYL